MTNDAHHAELLPCPFCGCEAHFEMDDDRWQWVECGSCGMQGNRSASLMDDCKPKLAEAWNSRAPAAPVPQEVARLRNAISRCADFIEHAPVSSGVCCCGDSMEGHADPMVSGHVAVDEWDWSASCMVQELRAIIAAAPQPPGVAPVELPEPAGVVVTTIGNYASVNAAPFVRKGEKFYTEQQVRELLAAQSKQGANQ